MAASRPIAEAREVLPGVWTWSVHDERIDFVGSSHAVAGSAGTVLIDPHALADDALRRLGDVVAIVLTAGCHERAAWHYRDALGAPVHAPANARRLAQEPDVRYGEGDRLPGDLLAVYAPGPGPTQHALLREGDPGVLFCADQLVHTGGRLRLVAREYLVDRDETLRSLGRLLELPFDVLCVGHGEPLLADARRALRALLASEPGTTG